MQGDGRAAVDGQQLLLDARASIQSENPARPGIEREKSRPGRRRWKNGAGLIPLRGNGEPAPGGLDPGFQAADEHHAAGRRRGGVEEQSVIPTGPFAANGSRGESTDSIGFEPFGKEIHSVGRVGVGAVKDSALYSFLACPARLLGSGK